MNDDSTFNLQTFGGIVRLFPLPNLVLFPHVVQPLHIFEPRYRSLMEDALAGDRLIAMAVLAPGWEQEYEGRPALRPFACLGRIASHQRLPDGRFNLLLMGLARLRLLEELPTEQPFRSARGELLEDVYPYVGAGDVTTLQLLLRAAFKLRLAKLKYANEQMDELLSTEMSLGTLTDLIAYTLDLELDAKVQLLSEVDVNRRARALLAWLETHDLPRTAETPPSFPPDFSVN